MVSIDRLKKIKQEIDERNLSKPETDTPESLESTLALCFEQQQKIDELEARLVLLESK